MTWHEYSDLICKICIYEDVTHQKNEWIKQLAEWVQNVKITKEPSKRKLEYEYFSAFESLGETAWTTSYFWDRIENGESELPPLENYIGVARKVYAFTKKFQPYCMKLWENDDEIILEDVMNKITEFTLI